MTINTLGNGAAGIKYDATTSGNIDKGNRTFRNAQKAVDLSGKNKQVDPNTAGDNGSGIDTGSTAGAPVLTSAVVSGNGMVVSGTLSSTPSASFTLEFFGNTDLDGSGAAEGEFYLGTTTVSTDANGNASFQVTLPAVYGGYVTATATNNAADGSTSEYSAYVVPTGEAATATVGGNVWDDANADGLPDNGETGAASVAVQLFTSAGQPVASTTTDAQGNYQFTGLAAGQYYLQFTAPSGYFLTTPYQGDDSVASHADPTSGQTEVFSLIAGEVDPYYSAGLVPNSPQMATVTALDVGTGSSPYGYPVTLTASVVPTDSVPLSGNVTFKDGNTVLGTVPIAFDAGGYQAAFTTSALAVGSHNLTAVYGGDNFHAGSTSTAVTQAVQQGLSFTSVSSSSNPAQPGQPVTLTASVTAAEGTPTGSVTFTDGSTTLGTATLDANGNAAFTTSALAAGSHNITATYGGDSNFGGSSGTLTQIVSQEQSSSVYLSSSTSTAAPGQSVTFTAYVSGSGGTPTGMVTFLDGNTVLGTATLSNGQASFTTTLSAGSHAITAVYGGDATFADSSMTVTQAVTPLATSVYFGSSASPSQPGQNVTFSISFLSGGSPTGSVTLLDGTTVLGTAALSNGQTTFSTSSLSAGSHAITAVYGGDGTYGPSSMTYTQTVGQASGASSTTSLASSGSPSLPGQSVTLTATVSGQSGTPTGSITFYDGTNVLGTGTLDASDKATFTTSSLSAAPHDLIAVYSGDGTYAASAGSLAQTVSQGGTSTSVSSSASSSPSGQPVTFTAAVTWTGAAAPTGTVTFYDGTTVLGTGTLSVANGQATASLTTAALGVGSHNILAVYGGDNTYDDSAASLTQTITS